MCVAVGGQNMVVHIRLQYPAAVAGNAPARTTTTTRVHYQLGVAS